MSPALAKTSDGDIVAAARALIADHGVDRLSLAGVAAVVGIKAPSLYKRFADRAALIDGVREDALNTGPAAVLEDAARHPDPGKQLVAMAHAYRRFGKDEPELYRLIPASGGGRFRSRPRRIGACLQGARRGGRRGGGPAGCPLPHGLSARLRQSGDQWRFPTRRIRRSRLPVRPRRHHARTASVTVHARLPSGG